MKPATQRQYRLPILATITVVTILVATACGSVDLLQRFRTDTPSTQVPREMATIWEIYQHLDNDYGGRATVDQRVLSQGTIQGMLDFLDEAGQTGNTLADYDLNTPDMGSVWEAWRDISAILENEDTGLAVQDIQMAAINGLLTALDDPYTRYLDTDLYSLELEAYHSDFEGIGTWVRMPEDQLTVVAPMPDSPAEQAGVLAGDIILEVDGVSLQGLSLSEATLRIRGPRGTPVELLVLHTGSDVPVLITVIREVIKQPTVIWDPLPSIDGIAYLRISQFLDDTDEDLEKALEEIASQEYDALIVDLRFNLGGLLSTTINATSQFLKGGLVLYQVDGHGKRTETKVKEGGLATEIPLVILVNGSSASGSEILAGALQDHQRATLIGTNTFGKGSVNELRKLEDGSGLYLTYALWYTPDGRLIEREGLAPDIVVPAISGQTGDSQLSFAITFLQEQIAAPVG